MPLSALITVGVIKVGGWRPLPDIGEWADHLSEVLIERPDISPDDLLAEGRADIGTEDPNLDDASLPARALGSATFAAGKGMAWLGALLGLKGLAKAGMKMMEGGIRRVPHMAESVFGKQEAKLRELLRAFQRGDIEKALRRALPLGGNDRGAAPTGSARLPFHNLLYSLRNLLGGSGGAGGLWMMRDNVYFELSQAYRRQAELAAQRGDYRRAAFIYGKLLNDFRAAAAVLSQGGFHADAAVLYLKRLGDVVAAAKEYEAAGEIDRAVDLYLKKGTINLRAIFSAARGRKSGRLGNTRRRRNK